MSERPTRPEIDAALITRLARLAHLALSEEEVARLTADVSRILGYVDTLSELDLEGVEPLASVVGDGSGLRADEPAPSLPHELALREAPRSAEGGFAVPAFVDEG